MVGDNRSNVAFEVPNSTLHPTPYATLNASYLNVSEVNECDQTLVVHRLVFFD